MAQYDVDLREYWRIIKKRKWTIILMTIFVGICSYVFSKVKEPSPFYRSSAAIKIEQQVDLSFIRSGGFWFDSESMSTHAYTLTSFPVLKEAAVKLGWIPGNLPDNVIQTDNQYISVLDRIKDMVTTEINEGTNIIGINVVSKAPEQAAQVANTIADAYRVYNIHEKNQRILDIKAYIENQLGVLSGRLNDAEKTLREFSEANSMIAVNEKTREVNNQLAAAKNEYENVVKQKNTTIQQISQINHNQIYSMAETTAKQLTYVPKDSPLYTLGQKLDDLISQRQSLLSKYTDMHPVVQDIQDKIQVVVRNAKGDFELYLNSLEQREGQLKEQIAQLEDEVRQLPEKENQLARLQKDVDLQAQLYNELQKKHQEILIEESGKMELVSIVKPAVAPLKPFNIPSKMMVSFTGLLLGLILGLVFGFGMEMFDTSMGTIEDVESSLQIPVLGVIPYLGGEEKGKKQSIKHLSEVERARDLITHYDPKSLASEAFRSLRTNLQFVRMEKKNKVFLVTSAFVKEGKTINTVNLALSLAQAGEKVLMIDADLRRSLVYKIFGLSRSPGLTDYVLGDYQWREVVNTITDTMLGDFEIDDILKTPGLDNLHMITSGTKPPNPTEILSSSRFHELLREASLEYTYVLIDSPPVLPVADPCEIAPYTDGVILVYTVGRIARGILKRAKATLDNVDANVIGVILNNVKPEVGPDYFKYHTYYYYGPDKERKKDKDHSSGLKKIMAGMV